MELDQAECCLHSHKVRQRLTGLGLEARACTRLASRVLP